METPRAIYILIKDDDDCIAEVRAFAKQLALDCLDPDKAMETTSFTLNGQSAAGVLRGTKADLLGQCTRVLWMVDNGGALSTRRTGLSW